MPIIVRVQDSEGGTGGEYAFDRSPIRVGRSPRNDLCLRREFVSTWHGVIDFDDGSARYTDLGSTNGTLLNGEPVEGHAAKAIGAADEIVIGSLHLTITRPRARVASSPTAPPQEAAGRPGVAPGGITALMKQLAAAPPSELDGAWRRIFVPGATIGRFELNREVGRGSFGVVFEAKDRKLGRLVAFKAVRPGRDSQMMFREELLHKEAEAVAQLNHPNIVSLYDVGTCDAGPFLIMELLKGETLRDRMARGRLPLREAIEIGVEIGWALDHAHASGVIHRDLKPANVFLCTSGHVKVLDFGIAHVFGAGASKAVGTPAYMAPEQWRQQPQDPRTDVFGASAMLAEMVTGRLPYRATKDSSTVLERDARPSIDAAGLPPKLVDLLRRGLAPDPKARPRDGHSWLAALLAIHESLDETPALGSAGAVPERHARASHPHPQAPSQPQHTPRLEHAVVPPARRARVKGAAFAAAIVLATGLAALAYAVLG